MPPLNRPVDKDVFPLPVTFERVAEPRPVRGGRAAWVVRTLLLLAAMGLIASLVLQGIGPESIAMWYQKRAEERYRRDDISGAIADLNQAIAWLPDHAEFYFGRARLREEADDLAGSLEDYNRLIELKPNFYRAYAGRSTVYQRLKRHREAIDDVTRAMQLRPQNDHMLLNHRAYTRAVAHLELEEALEDIQQAIELIDYEEPAYLDTRGYIYYLLERHEDALVDLDRAVELTSLQRKRMLQSGAAQRWSKRERARQERALNEHEAVMVYHRGLAHEKLGHHQQAHADKQRGVQLGYNPAAGVY
jgi:tetratricopeptide (TPR) repeat protein